MDCFASGSKTLKARTTPALQFAAAIATMLTTMVLLPQAVAAPALAPVVLQLDGKPTARFAGMLVASSRGFYRQVGGGSMRLRIRMRPRG